jgi:hypothetical protein
VRMTLRRGALGVGLLVFGVFALPSAAAAAQQSAAALSGVVRDEAGGVLPDAVVTVLDLEDGVSRTEVTGDSGAFGFTGLGASTYRITAGRFGFRSESRNQVRLEEGETVQVDFVLSVTAPGETVAVTSSFESSAGDRAGLAQVVERRRVVDLPLNGRSFLALTSLAPGVARPPGSEFPRINGGRPRTNEYLYDGISVLQPEPGQVAFLPVIDAVQEFRVESNSPAAEFGRFNGGVIDLTTRAGSNALRGTGFGFGRHEALNARNFFAPRSSDPSAKPLFRRHQVGFVAGGPIRRDRTFFFADYQGTRQRISRVRISTVPTVLQRQGLFTEPVNGFAPAVYDPETTRARPDGGVARDAFADGRIPDARIDPVARALLGRFPLPTHPGTANNYRRAGVEAVDAHQFDLRVDRRLATADRAFLRLSHFRDITTPVTPLPDGSGALTSGAIGATRTAAWALASSYQHALGGKALHEVRVGYTRRAVVRGGVTLAGPVATELGLPGVPFGARFSNALPTILIDGVQHLGSPAGTHSDFRTDVTQLVDTLTWTSGSHVFKAGLDFRWFRLDVTQPPSPAGAFRFSSLFTNLPGAAGTGSPLASFLLGQVETFTIDLQRQPLRPRAHVQEYFVQDAWRPHARLTVNAGVRYTLNFPSTEVDDQAAVFNLDTRRLDFLGREGRERSARRLHPLNFGPRLTLVGRASDRTTMQAGYGLVWTTRPASRRRSRPPSSRSCRP